MPFTGSIISAPERLASAIRADIESGRYAAGSQLPGSKNGTTARAYRILAASGHVVIIDNLGTFVV